MAEPGKPEDLRLRAEFCVKEHAWMGVAAGLIPVPIVDLAGVMLAQVAMLRELCRLYDVPFQDQFGKSMIGSLVGTLGAQSLARRGAASLIKAVPFAGFVIGGLSLSVMSGASTYALGRVFASHLERGGTLFDFDPEKARAKYKSYFEEGKRVAREARAETKKKTAKKSTAKKKTAKKKTVKKKTSARKTKKRAA